jgi:hypothetical protein
LLKEVLVWYVIEGLSSSARKQITARDCLPLSRRATVTFLIHRSVRLKARRTISHIVWSWSQLRVPHSLLLQHSLRGKRRYNMNILSSTISAQSAVALSVAACLSGHPQSWFSLSCLRPFDGVSACSRMIIPTPQHHATSTRIQPLDPISI